VVHIFKKKSVVQMICPKCGRFLLAREGILQAGCKYHRHCWTCGELIIQIDLINKRFFLLRLAQCSTPLTTWVRQQPVTCEYLCNNCHIKKNGLREGLVVVAWQKQTKAIVSENEQ
jgi:hypothetical protein